MAPTLAATAVIAAAAVGCGSGHPAAAAPQAPEKTHITVAAVTATDEIPFWIAIKNGYFRQQGLTVTAVPVTTSTLAIPDLLDGHVDVIAGGNDVSFFGGQAKGTFNVRLIAPAGSCTEQNFSLLTRPGTSVASLAGQNVSVPVTASINTLLISRALSAHGVNPSGVHFVDVPFVTALAALQAHRVAAIGMIEPFLSEAEAAGAQTLMPLCTGSTASLPLSGDFATASWVSRYPRTAAAFQRALAKAAAIASSNRAEDETMLKAHVKLSAAVAAQVHFNAYPAALQAAQIQKVADLMFGGGLLKSRLNVTPLLFKGTG